MNFLNYLLVSLAAFSGLWVGVVLSFISPEEMKPGKRYFKLIVKIVFIIIPILIAVLFGKEKILLSLLLVLVSLAFIMYAPEKYIYPMLGIFLYISSKEAVLFLTIGVAIFILGLPKGSLFAYEHKGMKKNRILRKIIICHIFFFILALPLYFSNL